MKENKKKDERIKEEKERLIGIYSSIPKDKLALFIGLIDQAAFMRVELEEMAKDIIENGTVEQFRQSENQDYYDRERPIARQYTQMVGKYQSALKTLEERLPKTSKGSIEDGFMDFVNIR